MVDPGAHGAPTGSSADGSKGASCVPTEVVQGARAAFAARRDEVVVVELVRDSRDAEDCGDDDVRLDFELDELRVTVHLTRSGDAPRLVLQVRPPVAAAPRLRPWHGRTVVLDEVGTGRWSTSEVPTGPVSIWLSRGSEQLRTAWARL